jgi:hypothetical protein
MRGAVAIPFAAVVLVLAGCSTSPSGPASPAPTPIESVVLTLDDFCPAVSDVVSAAWNADVGVIGHGVTAEEWATRHAEASELAAGLVESYEGELRTAAERLRDAVDSATGPPVGTEPTNYAPVSRVLGEINNGIGGCVQNGTEVGIFAEWGG